MKNPTAMHTAAMYTAGACFATIYAQQQCMAQQRILHQRMQQLLLQQRTLLQHMQRPGLDVRIQICEDWESLSTYGHR
jgi:hypothetical protein